MQYYYAKSANGFFNDKVNKVIPEDAVKITQDQWTALLDAQNTGKIIQADSNGYPVALDPPPLGAAEQARAAALQALSQGISVTSTTDATLNATYTVDDNAQKKVNAVSTFIMLNNVFPGGSEVLPWWDAIGVMHTFKTINSFKAFATALANYVAVVDIYMDSGGTIGSLPTNHIALP